MNQCVAAGRGAKFGVDMLGVTQGGCIEQRYAEAPVSPRPSLPLPSLLAVTDRSCVANRGLASAGCIVHVWCVISAAISTGPPPPFLSLYCTG